MYVRTKKITIDVDDTRSNTVSVWANTPDRLLIQFLKDGIPVYFTEDDTIGMQFLVGDRIASATLRETNSNVLNFNGLTSECPAEGYFSYTFKANDLLPADTTVFANIYQLPAIPNNQRIQTLTVNGSGAWTSGDTVQWVVAYFDGTNYLLSNMLETTISGDLTSGRRFVILDPGGVESITVYHRKKSNGVWTGWTAAYEGVYASPFTDGGTSWGDDETPWDSTRVMLGQIKITVVRN